jgi:hypothetical protein
MTARYITTVLKELKVQQKSLITPSHHINQNKKCPVYDLSQRIACSGFKLQIRMAHSIKLI